MSVYPLSQFYVFPVALNSDDFKAKNPGVSFTIDGTKPEQRWYCPDAAKATNQRQIFTFWHPEIDPSDPSGKSVHWVQDNYLAYEIAVPNFFPPVTSTISQPTLPPPVQNPLPLGKQFVVTMPGPLIQVEDIPQPIDIPVQFSQDDRNKLQAMYAYFQKQNLV